MRPAGQATGDPFVEFDKDRCSFARSDLQAREPDRFARVASQLCAASAKRSHRAPLTKDLAACLQDYDANVLSGTLESSTAQPLESRLHQLTQGNSYQHLGATYCEFLAMTYKNPSLATNPDACPKIVRTGAVMPEPKVLSFAAGAMVEPPWV